ncbi:MAG: aconitase X catalytic domain-containing protein [Deltaproteobacteria bacterium]|nr:aconitase X catalytic domain-containing protein [Deltaproteobacteria bacterium]
MILTKEEKAMLAGKKGRGIQKAISILVKYGKAFDAERLAPVISSHIWAIDPYEFLLDITDGVDKLGVGITTTHPLSGFFDMDKWQEMGVPDNFAKAEAKLFNKRLPIYKRLNVLQTFTCLPTLVGNSALKGQIISWMGSGVQLMANSLIGARANREGITTVLAAAITGRTPYMGLLKPEKRLAEIIVRLKGINIANCTDTDLQAVSYYIGEKAQDKNIVIDGLPNNLAFESLKSLLVPLAVSGAVGICHIAGITPEAPTIQASLGGKKVLDEIIAGKQEMLESYAKYPGQDGENVDLVVFGCPHLTVTEIGQVAALLHGRKVSSNTRLWLGSAEQIITLAGRMGFIDIIEQAGGVFARCCMAGVPFGRLPNGTKTLATNSIKAAHYISRLTRARVIYGTTQDCVESAITGVWKR